MTIELNGHLDTSKVADVKEAIDAQLANATASEHVVVDCSKLEYISSSGLRILLAMRKQHPDMEIVDVSTEVYNVFEMTGFTRILNVKKALRRINLDECQLIGEGGNGAVYRINDEEIVKICKRQHGDKALIHESEQVREAFLSGVPTVISFDTVDCGNGRKGIVMEALESQSLGSYLAEDPSRMDEMVPKYVELYRQANAVSIDSPLFPDIKEWLRKHLTLPQRIINDEEAALLESILDAVPDDNKFIHFDSHVGNVLMYGPKDNKSLMVIDMGDSGKGHPVLEIAGWAFMMLEPDYARGCTPAEKVTSMSREMCREFGKRVVAEMFHITDEAEKEHMLNQAALVGRVKAAFISLRWATAMESEKGRAFFRRYVKETLTMVPEIKAAVRLLSEK